MDRPMSNLNFRFMSFAFKFRDFFKPRKNVLRGVDIRPGFHVLDYGCGPGSYTVIAAKLVGNSGKVYALDIHPLAIQKVQDVASKKGLTNVETILSDCATGLESGSVDVVLLYDTFHSLSAPDVVLKELHRVLRVNGIISFSDHHMEEDEIISEVTSTGLFNLSTKGEMTYTFLKLG